MLYGNALTSFKWKLIFNSADNAIINRTSNALSFYFGNFCEKRTRNFNHCDALFLLFNVCCLEIRLLANIFYMESKLTYQIQIGCFLHTSSKNVNHRLIMKN